MEIKDELEKLQEIDKVMPSSYTLNKINKRNAIEKEKKENAIKIILEAVEYYNKEYPNSKRGITWSQVKIPIRLEKIDDIDDFLAKCSEKELFDLRKILIYTQKEFARKVKARDQYDLVIARVKKRIPGIKYVERLEGIKEKEDKIVKKRKEYEALIHDARQEFESKRLEIIKNPIKEEIVESEVLNVLEPYWCTMCAREHIKGKIYQDHLKFKGD